MKWVIGNEVFTDAYEAADIITGGYEIAETTVKLELMYDGEEADYNGYMVTSYLNYEE